VIDFPTSPSVGQVYTYLDRTWVWEGTGWQRQFNAGQQVAVFIVTGTLVQQQVTAASFIANDFHEITYV
jgi:uncharacterized NAD-dependent epimerase/dehydratase family protein